MLLDIKELELAYQKMEAGISTARKLLGRPLTLTEKILYGHLYDQGPSKTL